MVKKKMQTAVKIFLNSLAIALYHLAGGVMSWSTGGIKHVLRRSGAHIAVKAASFAASAEPRRVGVFPNCKR